MKLFLFFALIFTLLAPVFSAATINERSANNLIAREGGSEGDKLNDIVGSIQSNGLRKLDFYHNGHFEGSAIETKEGGGLCPISNTNFICLQRNQSAVLIHVCVL